MIIYFILLRFILLSLEVSMEHVKVVVRNTCLTIRR